MTTGLHIIKFPSGRFGFVGEIPTALCYEVPATKAAIMGGRAVYNSEKECVELKAPSFETARAAFDFAAVRGFEAKTNEAL